MIDEKHGNVLGSLVRDADAFRESGSGIENRTRMDLHSFTVGQGDSPWTNKVSRGFFPWLSNSVARRYFTVSAARMLETLATFACSNMDGNTILEAREPEMCAKASGKAGDTGMAHYFVVPFNGRVNERFREDNRPLVVDAFANQLSAMENLELEIIIVS